MKLQVLGTPFFQLSFKLAICRYCRLRYQGSYLSPIAAKNNGEHSTKHAKPKDITKKSSASKVKLEELNFSFEMVPKSEPWYETFQRQDNGDECYSCYNYFSGTYQYC